MLLHLLALALVVAAWVLLCLLALVVAIWVLLYLALALVVAAGLTFFSSSSCREKHELQSGGTFSITYGDGDCDKRLDLLRLDKRLHKSDWCYEHVICEWSCILD